MKKLLVVWIAVICIVCIVAAFLAKNPRVKEVATATSKIARVVIPEKRAEGVEKPKIAEEPKPVENFVRVESEKPEEVEKLKAEIATLEQKIETLEQAQTAKEVEKPSAEIPVYEPKAEEPQEPQEQECHERPFVCPFLLLDLTFNPYWYGYYWNWHWSNFYYYSYFWGYPYWTRPFYYSYDNSYGYGFYRGHSVIQKNQLQAPRSRISTSYPSRITARLSNQLSNNGRFESPWGDLRGTQTLRRSTASPRQSSLSCSTSPRSYSSSRSLRPSSRSSSTRSAPSRPSSGSIRKK